MIYLYIKVQFTRQHLLPLNIQLVAEGIWMALQIEPSFDQMTFQ